MEKTVEQIAEVLRGSLIGAKLVRITPNPGPIPAITLVFENEREEQAEFTFQPGLLTNGQAGLVQVTAQINININGWHR